MVTVVTKKLLDFILFPWLFVLKVGLHPSLPFICGGGAVMHTCAHVRATGGCWASSLSLYTCSLETVSLTRPFTSSLDDSQQALETFLSPLHPSTEVMGTQM